MTVTTRRQMVSHESTTRQPDGVSRGHGPAELARLRRWVRSPTTSQRVVRRSLIVLLGAAGHSATSIAAELGITRRTVALWQQRYRQGGPETLLRDAPGRGRKKGRNHVTVARILEATRLAPPDASLRWTVRSLARHLGVSHATVHRVWREHGLDPAAGRLLPQ